MISIGDGLAVAFKIESHNHPSAVEPYQGAATGVGGILRDVFAMGARPIAVLDALRFGDPSDARTRHLVDGVVRGVGGYGNCVGVPTVGGELVFDPSYQGNPLVNVMAIGLLEDGMLTRASADGPGNLVVLYGSATGRDGIGGASVLASATFGDQDPSKRPSVQVGDPFAEKLLIEATPRAHRQGPRRRRPGPRRGRDHLRDVRDRRPRRHRDARRPRRDPAPRARPGAVRGDDLRVAGADGRDRRAAPLGGRRGRVRALGPAGRGHRPGDRGARHRRAHRPGRRRAPSTPTAGRSPGAQELARIPAAALASEAIVFQRESRAPTRRRAAPAPGAAVEPVDTLPLRGQDPGAVLLALLGSPNLSSRRAVYEQYDYNVQSNTVAGPGRGAAVLRIKGTTKALVATTDANAPVGAHRPVAGGRDVRRRGGAQRRRSPARGRWASRTASTSATRPGRRRSGSSPRPSAASADACLALGLPVTGGNVSLYNESPGSAIAPTPEIGIVGLLDDVAKRVGPGVPRRRQRGPAGRRGRRRPRGLRVRAARRRRARGRPAGARPRVRGAPPGVHPRGRRPRPRRELPGRVGRRPRGRARRDGDLGRRAARRCGSPSATRRPSACSARARPRWSCEVAARHVPAFVLLARQHGLPGDELGTTGGTRLVIELAGRGATGRRRGAREPDRRRARRRRRRPAPRVGPRAAAGARLGGARHGCRAADRLMCGVVGVVLPDRGHEAAGVAATALFALQHRGQESAGVGGLRRPPPDDLQGPGHGRPGARRAADPVAHGRPRRRALPLLDDRLDGLGERPADAPPRAAAGARHRPQRQPRQHPRAARPARRRPRPPRREHRHGAPDRAPRRRAGGQHGRRPAQGAAAGPRRVQPRDPRRGPGHRRARPARVPPARPRAAAERRRRRRRPRAVGRRHRPAGSSPRRPPPSTSSARSTSATSSPARSSSSSPAASRSRSATPRRRPPCACSSSSTSPGRTRTWRGATCTRRGARWGCSSRIEHAVDADLVMPVPDTGAPGGRRLRRGIRHPVPRGHGPQPVQRPDVHPAVARRCASAAST